MRLPLAALVALATACTARPVTRPSSPPPQQPPPDPRAVDGRWSWAHVSDADGVRRVEHELWQLERDGDHVRGRYRRTITFLALDGKPFECSQNLSYRLDAVYQLSGRLAPDHVELDEDDYEVASSPCERGFRTRTHYRARVADGRLHLDSDHGGQVLEPAAGAAAAPPDRPDDAAGTWTWSTRGVEPSGDATGAARVEHEEWRLQVAADGVVEGTYLRTVTVYDPDGRPFPCSGAPQFQYRDRYRVRGAGSGRRLTLTEIAAEPVTRSPCVPDPRRHLDAAVGTLDGEYLVLEWRGGRRQVLHRPAAAQR